MAQSHARFSRLDQALVLPDGKGANHKLLSCWECASWFGHCSRFFMAMNPSLVQTTVAVGISIVDDTHNGSAACGERRARAAVQASIWQSWKELALRGIGQWYFLWYSWASSSM